MDDGHAEKQPDVTPDLGVQVGQRVVVDDALHLGVPPEVQIDVAHVLLVEAVPVGRHPREELHRGAWPVWNNSFFARVLFGLLRPYANL